LIIQRLKSLAVSAPEQPNVLFVLTDQQRQDWVGGHPEVPVRTPNLDALGERGVHFTNAVTPAPLCAPARTCLASGLSYDRCGILDNENYPFERPTLYQRLRDAGYETIGVGDIDLHMESAVWGLDGRYALDAMGFSDGVEIPGKRAMVHTYRRQLSEFDTRYDDLDLVPPGVDPGPDEPANAYMADLADAGVLETYVEDMEDRLHSDRPVSNFATTDPAPIPPEHYVDNWVGQRGLEHLREAPVDQPWNLVVNFVGPHEPMDITAEMHEWYRDPTIEFPSPVNPGTELDEATHQEIRRNYAAMCENVDRWLGRYLETLEERGERENTIIVFASDHGELLGDHGAWTKKSPRHASLGVPMTVAGHDVESRGRCPEPVSLLDLHATILEYAGIDPGDVDSRSLRPLLTGETDEHRAAVTAGLDARSAGSWRAVFDGHHKLIVSDDLADVNGFDGTEESPVVFDLEADPGETVDVAAEVPAVRERLSAHLPRDAPGA
jgi:arylsulfatase A-like enzyme